MTIRETVKQALTQVPGNKPFSANIIIPCEAGNGLNPYIETDQKILSADQVRRALRDIPYVRKLDNGCYVVKGRKVPPKVDITTS